MTDGAGDGDCDGDDDGDGAAVTLMVMMMIMMMIIIIITILRSMDQVCASTRPTMNLFRKTRSPWGRQATQEGKNETGRRLHRKVLVLSSLPLLARDNLEMSRKQ